MAKPATIDLDLVRGDSLDLYIGVKRAGVRIDLTGCTVTGQVRTTVDDATVAATWQCTLANQTTDRGGIVCHLSPSETTNMNAATYVHDIQIDFPNGDRTTFGAGKITMTKDVTRDA